MKQPKSDKKHPSGNDDPSSVPPDLTKCRARRSGFGDYVDCLSEFSSQCEHALVFGYGSLCRHPARFELVAQTEAAGTGK